MNTELRRLGVDSGEPLVAAVSGGADSCALLAALADLRNRGKIDNRIIAAHFEHGIRGAESVADEKFTLQLAERLGTDYRSGAGDPDDGRGNLEQWARRARYRFLENVAVSEGSSLILTGHTLNDQAETFLMNVIRGSGHDGLSAVHVKRSVAESSKVWIVRPLVTWANRSDTEEYCRERGIEYRNDDMNDDLKFKRIRIRKELIPLLEEYNPKIIEALVRNAETALETRNAIAWLTSHSEDFSSVVESECLPVMDLVALPSELHRMAAREWLKRRIGNLKRISTAHIASVVSLATTRKSGKLVELPGGIAIVKESGSLKLRNNRFEKTGSGDYN
ncbi:MAG: tRNA lysidine(34) synthetase TilS [Acidobacteriota bacterium]|nr:tRNA lysidine(34) synthetase TilS [Acidobacteriota bacterium]